MKRATQLELKSYSHGGTRPGAGRKKLKNGRRKVAHRTREKIEAKFPFHLTVRFKGNPLLRRKMPFQVFRQAIARAKKLGLRVIQFHLLGNHYHLECEADSKAIVTRALRSINGSLARRLGIRVEDRYHVEIARTPAQVKAMLVYIFTNAAKHFQRRKVFDYFSSFALFAHEDLLAPAKPELDWSKPKLKPELFGHYLETLSNPQSWLARTGWMRAC